MTQAPAPVRDRLPLLSAVRAVLPSAPGTADLAAALGPVSERESLHTWLRQVHADPAEATQVAARSYWHPNGFAKLLLHVEPRFRIRLHVWLPGHERRGETNPHGHRWDFASTVICGDGLAITEHAECPAEDGEAYVRQSYDGRCPVPVGRVHLRPSRRHTVARHERYTTGTDIVHTAKPIGSSLVATLVVQGPVRHATTTVYLVPDAEPDPPNTPIDEREVRHLVGEVLADLERQEETWR